MTTTITGATGVSKVQTDAIEHGDLPSGSVLQVVNFQTGEVATGTTTIPLGNFIPQISQGNEFMTLAVTPISATSKLLIQVVAFNRYTTSAVMLTMLFKDTATYAVAGMSSYVPLTGIRTNHSFNHYMASGTTNETTFRVRMGGHTGGTITFNGNSGSRELGGVMASSITITEIEA